jgi:hypothetical protein
MDTSTNSRAAVSPDKSRHGTERRLRSKIGVGLALAVVLMATGAATALAADAIGPFKFTGQLTGTVGESLKITEKLDGATLPAVGCQVQQSSTPEDLIHFATLAPKIKDDGKALGDLDITTEALKYGDTEKIAANGPQMFVTVSIGTKNSEWTSTSGTLEMKDKGLAGSFNVGLIPSSKAPGGNPVMSGGAAKAIHVSGSWSDCRPYPGG